MTDAEVTASVTFLAANPAAGDEMAGTGGCQKLRVAGRGKGKSGGYRTVTFYSGRQMPVFVLAVFLKREKANLSRAECNGLAKLTKDILAAYRGRVVKTRRQR